MSMLASQPTQLLDSHARDRGEPLDLRVPRGLAGSDHGCPGDSPSAAGPGARECLPRLRGSRVPAPRGVDGPYRARCGAGDRRGVARDGVVGGARAVSGSGRTRRAGTETTRARSAAPSVVWWSCVSRWRGRRRRCSAIGWTRCSPRWRPRPRRYQACARRRSSWPRMAATCSIWLSGRARRRTGRPCSGVAWASTGVSATRPRGERHGRTRALPPTMRCGATNWWARWRSAADTAANLQAARRRLREADSHVEAHDWHPPRYDAGGALRR